MKMSSKPKMKVVIGTCSPPPCFHAAKTHDPMFISDPGINSFIQIHLNVLDAQLQQILFSA